MTGDSWIPQPRCCWCQSSFDVLGDPPRYVCPTPACAVRQYRYALSVGGKLVNLPLPKQVELYEAADSGRYASLYYGGALGGSKSHAMRWFAYFLCRRHRRFTALLLRRTIKELEKHHIQEVQLEKAQLGETSYAKEVLTFHEFNSLLQFGHCQHPDDVSKWLSTDYDVILFDELPTFEEQQFLRISTRTGRTARPDGWPGLVIAAGNPGPPWILEIFIDKTRDPVEYPLYNHQLYHFIPATLDDNPYMRADYAARQLSGLPRDLAEAWRFGRMDKFEAQFFREWDLARHLADVPKTSTPRMIGALRWGFAKPGIYLWAEVLPDGRLHVRHEHVFRELSPSALVETLKTQSLAYGYPLPHTYSHSELSSEGKGEDIRGSLARAGLSISLVPYDRQNALQRLHDWLGTTIKGQAGLTVNPACPTLLKQIPRVLKDPDDPDDMADMIGYDHAVYALLYLVLSRPVPSSDVGKAPYPEESAGALFQQAQQEAARRAFGS